MPMIDLGHLQVLLKALEEAPPCEKHGKEHLEICLACFESIQCSKCEPISCQCWNDE